MKNDNTHPGDYEERLNDLRRQKGDPEEYKVIINDLNSCANGSQLGGARNEFFPGWKDEDFKDLLMDLGENFTEQEITEQANSNREEEDMYYYLIYSTSRVELIVTIKGKPTAMGDENGKLNNAETDYISTGAAPINDLLVEGENEIRMEMKLQDDTSDNYKCTVGIDLKGKDEIVDTLAEGSVLSFSLKEMIDGNQIQKDENGKYIFTDKFHIK